MAIYGIGAGDEATFLARAIRHAASLNKYHASVHGTMSGSDFIELLQAQTNNEGSIAIFTIFSHAFPGGVMMNPADGFYSDRNINAGGGTDAAYVSDLVSNIEMGVQDFRLMLLQFLVAVVVQVMKTQR